ncbi:MAG: alpha/beta fold hydrolase [Gemmataceae bacterium]
MTSELVQVSTADGLTLDGYWQIPAQPCASVILLHGTGSNFYSSAVGNALAGFLTERSFAVLRINTRGHDLVATQGGRRRGAAYEVVDECRLDLQAWCDRVAGQESRVFLIGHSLGAVKAIYSQVHAPHPSVRGVVAISPPRLSYTWFSEHSAEFRLTYAQAQQRVAEGRGQELMEVTFPLPFLTTATGYLEKYGPEERYHLLNLLPKLELPSLVILGSKEMETNIAFQGLSQAIAETVPQTAVEVISGADHVYSGLRRQLGERIISWLEAQDLESPEV